MKTQNTKQESRNNQIQKVFLRSAAVIISFVLISFTVSAQGFWKQLLTNNSFGEMAILMVQKPEAELAANEKDENKEFPATIETSYFFIEQAADELLELENWMIDEVYFGVFNQVLQPASEPALGLESWMKNEEHFNNYNAQDTDKSLEIEAWMVDEAYWKL